MARTKMVLCGLAHVNACSALRRQGFRQKPRFESCFGKADLTKNNIVSNILVWSLS
jgi:hypothetical protein